MLKKVKIGCQAETSMWELGPPQEESEELLPLVLVRVHAWECQSAPLP